MPAIPDCYLDDQFGFRRQVAQRVRWFIWPISYHVTGMFETNSFVRRPLWILSQVFNVVDHNILSAKLAQLRISARNFQWLLSFLTGRTQRV